jgi:hypothetical protein
VEVVLDCAGCGGYRGAHAAEAPFVENKRIDEEVLIWIGGVVVHVVFGGEFIEHDLASGAVKRDAAWNWRMRVSVDSTESSRLAATGSGVDNGGTSL